MLKIMMEDKMTKLIEFGMISFLVLPTFVAAQEDGSALKKAAKGIEELQAKTKLVVKLNEQLAELNRRMDPNDTSVEMVRGEIVPYNLPRRIAQYEAEMRSRAEEINVHNATINEMASQIKTLSNGKHDLSAYFLPTDVKAGAEGIAKMGAIVDSKTLLSLGDRLKEIVAFQQDLKELSGVMDLVLKNLGQQPPVWISDNNKILLLCLETSKQITASAFSIQRFLYTGNAIEDSKDTLTVTLPREKAFIIRMLDLAHPGRAKNTEQRQQKIQGILDGTAEDLKKF